MKYLYSLLFLLICPFVSVAQLQGRSYVDSLVSELPARGADTNGVKLLCTISLLLNSIDPDTGIMYGHKGLQLAQELDWKKGVAKAYNSLGANNKAKNENAIALDFYLKALPIFEQIKDNASLQATYGNIGNVYLSQKKYDRAFIYDSMALAICEKYKFTEGSVRTLGNMGVLFDEQGNYVKALIYYRKALKFADENNFKSDKAKNLGGIAGVYCAMDSLEEAAVIEESAIGIYRELGDKNGLAINLGNMGAILYSIVQKNASGKYIGDAHSALSVDKAISYLKESIVVSKEIGNLDIQNQCYKMLSEADSFKGDFKEALIAYKLYADRFMKMTISDVVHEKELKDKLLEKDQKELVYKKKEKGFFIAGIVVLFGITVIIIRHSFTQKKTNRLLSIERGKSETLLLNILPSEVAEELKEHGAAKAKFFETVTVMFTDFVGFTQAGERMSPQVLVDELHSCFKVFDEIMARHNIEKIKTVGDAYLAVAGLPVTNQSHAENMVSAALEIREFMLARRAKNGDSTFEIRIGIHTGRVVAGIVGVKKFAYDIWGDTVNTAARMEQSSEPGKINISETTHDLVKNKFTCLYRGKIEAKHKGMIDMYFVFSK